MWHGKLCIRVPDIFSELYKYGTWSFKPYKPHLNMVESFRNRSERALSGGTHISTKRSALRPFRFVARALSLQTVQAIQESPPLPYSMWGGTMLSHESRLCTRNTRSLASLSLHQPTTSRTSLTSIASALPPPLSECYTVQSKSCNQTPTPVTLSDVLQ